MKCWTRIWDNELIELMCTWIYKVRTKITLVCLLFNCRDISYIWQISHAWRSSNYIVPITIFSTLYNIPKFFELRVIPSTPSPVLNLTHSDDILAKESEATLKYPQNYSLGPTNIRVDHLYVNIYLIYMNVIVNGKHYSIIHVNSFDTAKKNLEIANCQST